MHSGAGHQRYFMMEEATEIRIRPLRRNELLDADRIMRLAFGTSSVCQTRGKESSLARRRDNVRVQ